MSVNITQVDHGEDNSTASSYTFTARSLGSTAADRVIIVALSMRVAGTTTTVSSVTVAGSSASQIVSSPNNSGGNTTLTEIWAVAVAAGTTGDVVVTFSGSVLRCGVNVWRMVGASGAAASASGGSTADPSTSTLTIPANGAAVGYVAADYGTIGPAIAWTNLTSSLALTLITSPSFKHAGAMADFTTGGSTALTGDPSADSVQIPSGVFATWAVPAAGFNPYWANKNNVGVIGAGTY